MAKWTKSSIEVQYNLDNVVEILRRSESPRFYDDKKVSASIVDDFLFSGQLNSVLGPDGFSVFKERLKEVLKRVNDNDFCHNYINLDKMFEALLVSGVYYQEDFLPEELKFLKTNQRWLTAYRYIARNFPEISYADFREMVRRFQDSSGHSIYVTKEDPVSFQGLASKSDLFNEVVDVRAALLQLSYKQLKTICDETGAHAAKSIEETVTRIIEIRGDDALAHIPKELTGRRALLIKDTELATGVDIIQLDSYLRAIAKVVRQELVAFINGRRQGRLSRLWEPA